MTKMTTAQDDILTLTFTDSLTGGGRLIQGIPEWKSSDEKVVKVVPRADGKSAQVVSIGAGEATVTVTADGVPNPAAEKIVGTWDYEITSATGSGIVFSSSPMSKSAALLAK